MSFQDTYELTQNEAIRTKVKMATIKAAHAVLGAPERQDEFPFCYLIIKEPESEYWLNQVVYSVVSNPAISAESTDQDVEFTVNSVFGRHALAFNQR